MTGSRVSPQWKQMSSPGETPLSHTHTCLQSAILSEMPLAVRCLDALNDAGRFLPPRLSCLRDGSTCCSKTTVAIVAQEKGVSPSSIGPTIAPMTSRRQIQDGGPHDTKMAAPTTSGPRWRPPRHQDGGPTKSDTRWRPL